MANYQWPSTALPFASMRSALNPKPPPTTKRSEMESGKALVRRRFTSGCWPYPVQWVFTLDQFRIFQAVYDHPDALNNGAYWFDMMVFDGKQYVLHACRFVVADGGGYDAHLRGVTWMVGATLELEQLHLLTKAEVNALYPGTIP